MVRTSLIEAVVDTPHIVEISPRAKTVTLIVRTELRNVSEHDYVLHGSLHDDEHFWHLLDQKHREIAREKGRRTKGSAKKSKLHPAEGLTIAAGHSAHETEKLKFDAAKLKSGQVYTVRSEIWGQIAEATFTVVRPEKVALTKLTKPKPAKKTTASKSAKKTTAKSPRKTTRKATKK